MTDASDIVETPKLIPGLEKIVSVGCTGWSTTVLDGLFYRMITTNKRKQRTEMFIVLDLILMGSVL